MLTSVQPAYAAIREWLQTDRANAPTDRLGSWTLPNGEAYYNERLFAMTTLPVTADEVHATGLAEVARLRAAMEALKDSVGFNGSLQEFFVSMRADQRFYFADTDEGREAYLQLARDYLAAVTAKLPDYFGLLPKAGLDVKRVELFREQPGGAQHYYPGTPDGSRNGIFYAHLSDMQAMPRYTLEAIAYHEGLPGHHMQISIAQEQAVQYFLDNSPTPEATVRSEVERYIITPGQATAYKTGMMKIQQLRAQAEAALGDKFDIRGFHDTVLGGGALPLAVLEARVQRWIDKRLAGA